MIYPGIQTGNRNGIGFNRLIFISLLLHLFLLSLLIFSRSLLPAPKFTFGPVYSVQLVSMPANLGERRATEPSMREMMNVPSSGQSILKKESVEALNAIPIAPLETVKRSSTNIDNVLETIKKNLKSSDKAPSAASAPKVADRVLPAAPALTGKQGDTDLVDAKMKNYYALIWSRIKGRWTLPAGIIPRNIEAIIHAQIMRDGVVTNVGFEKNSGNRYFDDSALRAVKRASPLPPLPDGLRDTSIEVGIRFHSSELQ